MNRAQQLNLAMQPPLKSITIDGQDYPTGLLSEAQWADIDARAERLLQAARSGGEISEVDANPARHLFHLLLAGDPTIRQVGQISADNIITAAQEVMRQAALRALVPMTQGGEAQAECHVRLAEELFARQLELVSELERRGLDSSAAQRLLREFQEVLATQTAGRNRISDRIPGLKAMV